MKLSEDLLSNNFLINMFNVFRNKALLLLYTVSKLHIAALIHCIYVAF